MILRSPRLAVVSFERDLTLMGIRRLVEYMSTWDIPANVYVAGQESADLWAGHDPARATTRSLSVLTGQSWQRIVDVEGVSIGGDLTLLALIGTQAGDVPSGVDVVQATETPVIVVVANDDRTAAIEAVRSWPIEVEGFLVIGHGDDPSIRYEAQQGTAPRPLVDDLTDVTSVRQVPEDLTGAGAMLVLANRAPVLSAVQPHTPGVPGQKVPVPLYPGDTRPAGRTMMISATHSDAGKSFLATAFARYFADRGLSVAPFKGQNMSNNARVVRGGEIGVAQYIQALAARVVPDVRMNPVLIKPQTRKSHVMLLGQYDGRLSELPWRLRKPPSWPLVRQALQELREEHDLVIMEGAGSPAEPFQYHNDIVNMRVAREFATPTFLATDGARGGGIAHCYGTWQLLPSDDRALLKGFIINRFFATGNPAMLQPGCAQLTELTSVPTMGIIPELPYRIPEEDSYSLDRRHSGEANLRVAVVTYPNISNFDEFHPVAVSGVAELVWARTPDDLTDADLLILPGSKDVPSSSSWLRQTGLDDAIRRYAESGRRVLAICGGLQIVGDSFNDVASVEGTGDGIGLLELRTTYEADKIQRQASFTFGEIEGAWKGLSGMTVDGYEIRHGRTESVSEHEIVPGGVAFVRHNVLAIYFHGLLENMNALRVVLGSALDPHLELENTFDALANAMNRYLDMSQIEKAVF